MGSEPRMFRGHSVDSADRRGVAIFAGRVSFPFDLLAAVATQWEEEGVWLDAWRALLGALDEEGLLKWDETFLDGSFAPAKKGACRRQNQAGQGHEVDGTGRRSRYSAGSSAGKCLSGRSYACGSHTRGSPRSAAARPAATKAGAGDCRPRLRFRSVAPTTEEARHRTGRAVPEEQPRQGAMKMDENCGATNAAGSSSEPTRGSDSFAACWFVMSIYSPPTSLLLPRVLLDYASRMFMKHALVARVRRSV